MEDTLCTNLINYLGEISNKLPENSQTLKSFYALKQRVLQTKAQTFLPSTISKTPTQCQRCLLSYSDFPVKYRVEPRKKSKFARRLIRRAKAAKPLTPYQNQYYKKLGNCHVDTNKLVLSCSVCHKDSSIIMKKPLTNKTAEVQATPKGKKKRNKNKYCGLNEDIVNSVIKTPQVKRLPPFIPLNGNSSTPKNKRKVGINIKPQVANTGKISKRKYKEEDVKSKNKSKLNSLLNSSNVRSSPSVGLRSFLKSL